MPASSNLDEPPPATAVRTRVLLFEVRRLAMPAAPAPTGAEARRRARRGEEGARALAELRLAELHVVRRRRSRGRRERRALARRFLRALGAAAAQEAEADGLAAMMASLTTSAAAPAAGGGRAAPAAPARASSADGLGEMLEKMVVSDKD